MGPKAWGDSDMDVSARDSVESGEAKKTEITRRDVLLGGSAAAAARFACTVGVPALAANFVYEPLLRPKPPSRMSFSSWRTTWDGMTSDSMGPISRPPISTSWQKLAHASRITIANPCAHRRAPPF